MGRHQSHIYLAITSHVYISVSGNHLCILSQLPCMVLCQLWDNEGEVVNLNTGDSCLLWLRFHNGIYVEVCTHASHEHKYVYIPHIPRRYCCSLVCLAICLETRSHVAYLSHTAVTLRKTNNYTSDRPIQSNVFWHIAVQIYSDNEEFILALLNSKKKKYILDYVIGKSQCPLHMWPLQIN